MKNTTLLLMILGIIVLGIVFLVSNTQRNINKIDNHDTDQITTSNEQVITISMRNGNYYPNTIKVKENVPVVIILDKTVTGCYRSFVLNAFNLRQYSSNPADKIYFVPDKKGTFSFSCSMGMAFGKLIVE